MFSLRKETDYALQFLKLLAKNPRVAVSLNAAAQSTGLSFLFLQKIARKLRLAGVVAAALGVDGGYRLKLAPNKITLKKVITVIEGGATLWACGERGGCRRHAVCLLSKKAALVNNKFLKILTAVKLSDL